MGCRYVRYVRKHAARRGDPGNAGVIAQFSTEPARGQQRAVLLLGVSLLRGRCLALGAVGEVVYGCNVLN